VGWISWKVELEFCIAIGEPDGQVVEALKCPGRNAVVLLAVVDWERAFSADRL